MTKFATPLPTSGYDMPEVIVDATSAMHDSYDDTLLDVTMPLGEFLDEQIARVNAETNDIVESDEIIETEQYGTPARPSSPRCEFPDIPEGYVMEGEVDRDFLACKYKDDLKKLLCNWKEKSLNATMQYDPKFATSPMCVTDKDYEFFVDPELITLVESDPFHGYESKTVGGTPY
ncbi:hypothetical protein ZWY2020_053261 [Hordeum vulgare]|nr:hypothetical protein ZWY2020_053261 [Hordeum vulgare]